MDEITHRVLATVVWRQTRPLNDLKDVADPATYDGRYHRVGDPGTWYAALSPDGAWAEHYRHWTHADIDPYEVRRRFGRARVRDLRLLDLTSGDVRNALGVDEAALVGDDRKECQDLGARARAAGFDGLLVPSAALAGATNLVVFAHALHKVHVEASEVVAPPTDPRTGSGGRLPGYG
jgi:RES domain-containing protein